MPSTLSIHPKFVHINIVTRNWKSLVMFYKQVFGCVTVPPERDLSGEWLEDATGVCDTEIHGVHLRLPGYGEGGPTLEIFQYNVQTDRQGAAINRPGLAHIAFIVEDVHTARYEMIAAGGGVVGELVSTDIPGVWRITFVYATDPKGK
jgi:predicted enzyme related to lactoylglutathione lyase